MESDPPTLEHARSMIRAMRKDLLYAQARAESAEQARLRDMIFMTALEELANNGKDEAALHLITCWRGHTARQELWAQEMLQRAHRRLKDAGELDFDKMARARGLVTFGEEQYTEGVLNGWQKAVLAIEELAVLPSTSTEMRTAIFLILDKLKRAEVADAAAEV